VLVSTSNSRPEPAEVHSHSRRDADAWAEPLRETVAIYTSKLVGDASFVSLVNNRHPLIPLSTLQAGYRLLLHGVAAECLHATLVQFKRQQQMALAVVR